MRRAVAALLAVWLLAAAAAPAVAHGTELSGTVTDGDGRPVAGAAVLAEPADADAVSEALDAESPRAALAALAADPPPGVFVARTNASGGYTLHLDRPGRWRVVAVTDDGVSRAVVATYLDARERQDLAAGSAATDASPGTATPDRVVTVDLDGGGEPAGLLPVGVSVFVVGVAVASFAAGRTGVPFVER